MAGDGAGSWPQRERARWGALGENLHAGAAWGGSCARPATRVLMEASVNFGMLNRGGFGPGSPHRAEAENVLENLT